MNFNEVNSVFKYLQKSVYPNVQSQWKDVSTEVVLIDRYLSVVDDNRKYKLLVMPYLVNPEEFLKRHKDRCIIFYNTPDPQDGLMLFIHQISPKLHIHSKLYCWIEHGDVQSYIQSHLFYRDEQEAFKYLDSTFDLAKTGTIVEGRTGFHTGKTI